MSDGGGWLWLVIGVLGVGGLAVAIAYASNMWRKRPESPEIDHVKDKATHEVYEEEEKEQKREEGKKQKRAEGKKQRRR